MTPFSQEITGLVFGITKYFLPSICCVVILICSFLIFPMNLFSIFFPCRGPDRPKKFVCPQSAKIIGLAMGSETFYSKNNQKFKQLDFAKNTVLATEKCSSNFRIHLAKCILTTSDCFEKMSLALAEL